MKLNELSFKKIADGTKTIEIRLFDMKRQALKVRDIIEFSLASEPGEMLRVEIQDLHRFSTFKEMFEAFPPESYGSVSANEWTEMYEHYTKEEEEKFGVLAITLQKIN